nr:MAG TPA: hypothetical protein [Caudoviricetes sp.]
MTYTRLSCNIEMCNDGRTNIRALKTRGLFCFGAIATELP